MSAQALRARTARTRGGRALNALRNPLYRSGYALVANTVGTTAIGVAFWAVAAHLYDRQTLGRSSALISMLVLVASLSQLNLVITLPRFLPRMNRSAGRFIAYGYAASSGVALLVGLGFVLVLPRLSSKWHFMGRSVPLSVGFVAAAVVWVVFGLEDAALTGLRRATVVPVENIVYGLFKLLVLVGVAWALPTKGIFVAWVVPLVFIVPVINGLIFRRYLKHRDPPPPSAHRLRVRDIVRFASVDYIGSLIGQSYGSLLPLLMLSVLGAAATGNFYVAWSISAGLTMMAANFGTGLLVEGSAAPHRIAELTRGVLLRNTLVTICGGAVLALGSHLILSIYGQEYVAHSSSLLALLAVATIPRSILQITFALDRIAGRVGRAALTHLAVAVLVLGGSWILARRLGIDGVGLAWGGGNLLVAIVRLPTVASAARRKGPALHRAKADSTPGPRGSGIRTPPQGRGLHRRPPGGRHRAAAHPGPSAERSSQLSSARPRVTQPMPHSKPAKTGTRTLTRR